MDNVNLDEIKEIIEAFMAKNEKHFIINFSEISYIYSGAIRTLIQIYKSIKDKDGELGVLEPKLEVYDILVKLGINKIIPIYQSEDQLKRSKQ